ncbi:MAG: SDR family oxidoreductase [Magnetococcales bacterium]|nr:SDR family oxidoreductase [Magnetococcales bacterium]
MGPPAILITGCSSGIGRCVARGLKERGWRVFATARREEDLQALREEGLEALYLELNDSASIAAVVHEVMTRTGGQLDALFNNAAYAQPGAVEDLPRQALREQFETNLFGGHELICRILPFMRAAGKGRILQNSSVLGFVALPLRGAYVASKFALEGLSDTLRLELAGTGIRVILIEPGPIVSRIKENALLAMQRHIDPEKSVHRERYARRLASLEEKDVVSRFTLPPQAVLAKVVEALESPHPRARYRVTVPTRLMALAKRLLPTSLLDRLLQRGLW